MAGSFALGILMPQPQGVIVVLIGMSSAGRTCHWGMRQICFIEMQARAVPNICGRQNPKRGSYDGGMSKTGVEKAKRRRERRRWKDEKKEGE